MVAVVVPGKDAHATETERRFGCQMSGWRVGGKRRDATHIAAFNAHLPSVGLVVHARAQHD